MMRTRSFWVVLSAAVAVALVLAGSQLLTRDRNVLPASEPSFGADRVTWAQGSTIHYGDTTYDAGPEVVLRMLRTPYAFFLTLADSHRDGADQRLVRFDGEALTELPGDVDSVRVSPDGAHAGWVDFHGPLRPAGRIAEVVVVDLATGRTVFRDHEHMGGGFGDDLAARYGELPPTFLGFDDDRYAYWFDSEGSGNRWRVDLATGEKEPAGPDPDSGEEFPPMVGDPYNPRTGPPVWLRRGRVVDAPGPRAISGFLSPDGRFALRTGRTGLLPVTDAASGERVDLDHGRRWIFFGGWQHGSTLYALVRSRFEFGYDPNAPDRTRGTLVSCHLPSGHCTDLATVRGTWSLIFAHGEGPDDVL